MQNSSKKNDIENNTEKLDDTAYYDELYNDFPEDIKDILMETHPLRGKDLNSETASYRTRKREISEVEAVKKAHSKKIKEEINNMETNKLSESNNIKDSNNVNISKNIDKNRNKTKTKNNRIKSDDEYTNIQTVKIKPSSKKIIQDKPIQVPKNKRKNNNYTIPQKKSTKQQNKEYEEDIEKIVKNASIDKLYGKEDYEYIEDDKINLPEAKKLIIAGGAIFIILFLFFAFKTITLSSKLQKVNTELQTMTKTQEENEKLKMEVLSLQEELYKYTGTTETSENNSASTGNFDTYTVVAGDDIGSIAIKVYGDFSSYTKILEANGLTEKSNIQIGQVLKIPR